MHITCHAEKRLKQRLKVKSPKKQMRRASLALKRGTLFFLEKRGNREVRFFHFDGNDYLFDSEDSLITVYRHHKVGHSHCVRLPSLEEESSFLGMEY